MSYNVDGLNHCRLAHEIVSTTPCVYCKAPAGVRCYTSSYRMLIPSKSHRQRIYKYWRNKNANS